MTARLEGKEQAKPLSAPDGGQETLTPAEMAKKRGCKDDPAKVRLTP